MYAGLVLNKLRAVVWFVTTQYRFDLVILPKSNTDVSLRSAIFPAHGCRTYLTAEEQEEEF